MTRLPPLLCFCLILMYVKAFQKPIRFDRICPRQSDLSLSPIEAWDAYNSALEKDPLIVKSVTAGIILGAADLAGQAFERQQSKNNDSEINWARVSRFAIFGLVLQAPWNHFYYQVLDGKIPPTEDPFSATNMIKIVIDQFVQAPVFTVLIFVFLGLLEGKATAEIQSQLKKDYKDTIIANCEYLPTGCHVQQGSSH